MSEWAHDHPEEMEEIAKLPLSQQNEALRGAMVDPLEVADQQRKEARENPPEEFSTSFEEVPGIICGRCDGKGWTMKDKNVKECVACLGTGLEP